MLQIVDAQLDLVHDLDYYSADANFASVVAELRAEAALLRSKLNGSTVWMVNSTAQGGGVAEMLPRLVALLSELGVLVRWAVIGTDQTAFFALTKRLHNLIHGDAQSGLDLTAEDAALHEAVNRENAEELKKHLKPDDIVVVHDPQPLPLGRILAEELGLKVFWRCHIGLDQRTVATRAAWQFLRPHLKAYHHTAFSVPEYIPSFLAGKASLLYPAIDPLSHKNRELSVHKMIGILCNSGVQQAYEPVPTPAFAHKVQRITDSGETAVPGELGLLFRPIILQVSRWDRLKGWLPLLEGFARMKRNHRAGAEALNKRNKRRLQLSRLVLAGPDPSSIADDPEGLSVLEEIRSAYLALEPEVRCDVAVLLLPMASRKHNALIVNALQRCAAIVVQNSLQEGFGLTVTEAMWKRTAVLGTHACGIRQQIRDAIDGRLTSDAEDPDEIAAHLRNMLVTPRNRYLMGRAAQRRVFDEFLVFRQISRYLNLLTRERPALDAT